MDLRYFAAKSPLNAPVSPITVTMTTCKRLELFKRTFESFIRCCNDLEMIERFIVVDDGSSYRDIETMWDIVSSYRAKQVPLVIRKPNYMRGLGSSMNMLWSLVQTKYAFHLEDDWEFIQEGNFFNDSLKILERVPHVKSVLVRNLTVFPERVTSRGDKYHECLKGPDLTGEIRGHGYSLNPSVQDVDFLRARFGGFKERQVEGSFGEEYYNSGFRTATLMQDYVKHIGTQESAFDLNNTPR